MLCSWKNEKIFEITTKLIHSLSIDHEWDRKHLKICFWFYDFLYLLLFNYKLIIILSFKLFHAILFQPWKLTIPCSQLSFLWRHGGLVFILFSKTMYYKLLVLIDLVWNTVYDNNRVLLSTNSNSIKSHSFSGIVFFLTNQVQASMAAATYKRFRLYDTLTQPCQTLQHSSCFPQPSLLQTYNNIFQELGLR